MAAKAKGKKAVDPAKKLEQISRRVYEMEQNHVSDIKANAFVRFPAGLIIPEMRWLVDELRKARNLPAMPAVAAPADDDDDEAGVAGEGEAVEEE